MSLDLGVWGRHLRLWLPGLIFLLINLALLAVYRVGLAEEAEMGRARLARREAQLERLIAEEARVRDLVERATLTEKGLNDFYDVRLATESLALTRIIAEVKDLSRRAGLVPAQIDYERETFAEEDLLRRAINFPVDGSYQALRRLINFLELSDSFLVLESVGLRGENQDPASLRITLTISTLFSANAVGEAIVVTDISREEPGR